jgi:predicted HAD superfamily phosphohydrolase YqeG
MLDKLKSFFIKKKKKPIYFPEDNSNTFHFDVDNTLIIWNLSLVNNETLGEPIEFGYEIYGYPHLKHIELLKQAKAQGHFVVVWSAGGAKHAKNICDLLKITHMVDAIIPKPRWVCDDLEASDIIPEKDRFYLR